MSYYLTSSDLYFYVHFYMKKEPCAKHNIEDTGVYNCENAIF